MQQSGAKLVLNVGGGSKDIPIPSRYAGWTHHLLDIDPTGKPDIVCDARRLTTLPGGRYDAVYCAHNIEHYHAHEVGRVLEGIRHMLKADGFAEIVCPDLLAVMRAAVQRGLDLDQTLYTSPAGPITVRDVIYGYGKEIEQSGTDFYSHKTGFSGPTLLKALGAAGFANYVLSEGKFELRAIAFKSEPTQAQLKLLGLN